MSIPEESRSRIRSLVMAVYIMVDRIIPYVIKLTFPLWALPVICFMMASKTIRIWKSIISFVFAVFYPNTPPVLAYAILKGNGQYLRNHSQKVLVQQFYDYTSRRFMNIVELEPQSTVVEIETDNLTGLEYLAQTLRQGSVRGYTSCRRKIRNAESSALIEETSYAIEGQPKKVDCFLFFNFKSKVDYLKSRKIDLVQILNFCRYHLSNHGYLVFGDYFEKGEQQTFQMLFQPFDFKIAEEEDITRNIDYAKKLMAKDRNSYEMKMLRGIKKAIVKRLKLKSYEEGKQFHVLIMEKNQE